MWQEAQTGNGLTYFWRDPIDNLVPPAGKHFVEIGEMRMSRDNGSKSLPLDQWKDPLIIWTCECPLNILLTRVDYFEDERLDVLQAIIDGVLKSFGCTLLFLHQ